MIRDLKPMQLVTDYSRIYQFTLQKAREVAFCMLMSVCSLFILPQMAIAKTLLPDNLHEIELQRLMPEKIHKHTLMEIIHHLKFSHYLQEKYQLDNELSEWVLDHYIDKLDPNRVNFYQSDIDRIQAYRLLLDDALRNGNLKPGFDIYNTFLQRNVNRLVFTIDFLENHYDSLNFEKQESLAKDRSDMPWANTKIEMQDLWLKNLKAAILSMKLSDKTDEEIRSNLIKRYRNSLNHQLQTTSEEVFQAFINTLASIYDPHTQYMSPRASANFNINMSLSLEGIGAVLKSEDEYTKIVRLVPGGPADKSGLLSPADRIIGVGQSNTNIVDILGWKLEKVVELIRGPKGSTVFLEIKPNKQGPSKVIHIKRDKVELEDRASKSDIIWQPTTGSDNKDTIPIGVISIPTFYADFKGQQEGKKNYRRTSVDVKNLLKDLNNSEIQGLIIDLRNNGGGSLQEANHVLGLFIKEGPTVQVRDSLNRIDLHRDRDARTSYNGPLVVLVNRLSASASEIFAGAVQDYQRGLVVGSRTFGKGTVQALRKLSNGHLKFTQLKFYRISGASNQHLGIVPDIEFPSIYDFDEVGESAQENALTWDTIKPAKFQIYSRIREFAPKLRQLHLERIPNDPDFQYLTSQVNLFKKLSQKETISLNEKERREELNKNQFSQLEIENKRRKLKNLPIYKTVEEMENADEEKESKDNDKLVNDSDAELRESGAILVDLIQMSNANIAGSHQSANTALMP